jgi:hypothetical protein
MQGFPASNGIGHESKRLNAAEEMRHQQPGTGLGRT